MSDVKCSFEQDYPCHNVSLQTIGNSQMEQMETEQPEDDTWDCTKIVATGWHLSGPSYQTQATS